ncbi:hypothetical protein Patl1_19916 [Pistacia atlantica]|uniref:Uncharacterized protein n=1 Tax=Pistacia atlantica TaxID=434234 RepID=A0ACC1BIX7_9ROSI|nr:hypothetical protein Patl1_19916 [Pistacia atlantica]
MLVKKLVFGVIRRGQYTRVIRNPSAWEAEKFELVETARVLVGSLVQVFLISTIISLIDNMSPPKRAS